MWVVCSPSATRGGGKGDFRSSDGDGMVAMGRFAEGARVVASVMTVIRGPLEMEITMICIPLIFNPVSFLGFLVCFFVCFEILELQNNEEQFRNNYFQITRSPK